jgi:hypothetical protein
MRTKKKKYLTRRCSIFDSFKREPWEDELRVRTAERLSVLIGALSPLEDTADSERVARRLREIDRCHVEARVVAARSCVPDCVLQDLLVTEGFEPDFRATCCASTDSIGFDRNPGATIVRDLRRRRFSWNGSAWSAPSQEIFEAYRSWLAKRYPDNVINAI